MMRFLLLLLAISGLAAAQYSNNNNNNTTTTTTNTTIQYNDLTQINYQPPYVPNDKLSAWRFEDDEGVSYTNTTGANFTVHFTGNSIALYASKKHDRFNLRIVIDGKDTGYANEHQDVGTGPITLLYQYSDLTSGPHTFVGYVDGSAANSVPDKSFVALAYLVVSNGPGGGGGSSSGLSSKAIIGIAVGAGAGAATVLAVIAMLIYRRRRRTRITYESPQFVPASEVIDSTTTRRTSKPMGQITPLPLSSGRNHDYPMSSIGESLPGPAGGIPYDSVHPDEYGGYDHHDSGYFPSTAGSRPGRLSTQDQSHLHSSHSYTTSPSPGIHTEDGIAWSPPTSPRDELTGFLPQGKGLPPGAAVPRPRTDSWGEVARFGSLPVPGSGRQDDGEGLRNQVGSPPPPRYEH